MHSGFSPSFHGGSKTASEWQVSWLQGHLTGRAFPKLLSVAVAVFIACYSCGTAKELHLLPFYPCLRGTAPNPCGETIVVCFVADRRDECQREKLGVTAR